MGARDVVMARKQWTFQQGDIRFKRLQVAVELWREKLAGSSD